MCERCRTGRSTLRQAGREERAADVCEFTIGEEEDAEQCGRPVEYAREDWEVEAHLCDEHVAEAGTELDRGLGEFMREAGFQQAVDFLPIEDGVACEGLSLEGCGRRATHAMMTLETYVLCAEHAKRERWFADE